jgi:hypothetical protein
MASKELNEIRLANTLRLFESFCKVVAPGSNDLRGLEKAFAQNLGISQSYWAQIKSPKRLKGIGPNLARQFERKFGMGLGWLDKENNDFPVVAIPAETRYSVAVQTLEEQEFLELILRMYRENPKKIQQALIPAEPQPD